jgi:hypothetical protein
VEEDPPLSVGTGRLSAVTTPNEPLPTTGAKTRTTGRDDWRAEVGALRSDERRRRFPMGVHVGTPVGRRRTAEVLWPVPDHYDAGLRLDLLSGLLDAFLGADRVATTGPAAGAGRWELFGWVTRPGEPVLHDRDLEWYSSAAHAFAAYDVRLLGFRAVTRSGWLDVVNGDHRVWRRLRL